MAAGQRAVAQLKPVLAALRMSPIPDAVMIPWVGTMVDDGVFRPSDAVAGSVKPMLDELVRVTRAHDGVARALQ